MRGKPFGTNQPREDIKEQLKEFSANSMMQNIFPNLSILANICLTIPVGTASVERSFSHMKMIKTRLRNRPKYIQLVADLKIKDYTVMFATLEIGSLGH